MKQQWYYFSNNEDMKNIVMSLEDIMATISADSEEEQGAEDDVKEYTITPCYLTEEEVMNLHEAEF